MIPRRNLSELGALLKARRREKRMSLRALSDQIGVSFNTLSRVERGQVPSRASFQRIIDWLEIPAESFAELSDVDVSTPEVIARHLRSDSKLSSGAADQIAGLVEEMYHRLRAEQPTLAVHLRSSKTFTPAAGVLLSEILLEMRRTLERDLID